MIIERDFPMGKAPSELDNVLHIRPGSDLGCVGQWFYRIFESIPFKFKAPIDVEAERHARRTEGGAGANRGSKGETI